MSAPAHTQRRLSGDDRRSFVPLPQAVGEGPQLALFDFDGTLSRRETMLHWLAGIAGWRKTLSSAMAASLRHRFVGEHHGPDRRTRFKTLLLNPLLAGVPVERGRFASEALASRFDWLPGTLMALEAHLAAGHRVVIATGAAPDCAAPLVQARWGISDILGTRLEVADGIYTGRLAGPNCVRADKAAIVADFIARTGPWGTIHGYGNTPHDLPMLALCHHRTVIG